MSLSTTLTRLEHLRFEHGPEARSRKLAAMRALGRAPLSSSGAVLRLHEALLCIRAYPDDAEVLAAAEALLARFGGRRDLRAHRDALADSGIANTRIYYRFFAAQAEWLATRWPERLSLVREDDPELDARLARALPQLLTPIETIALTELKLSGFDALDRVRGREETDATFLLRRIARLQGSSYARETVTDTLDAAFVLEPSRDTPSRTLARVALPESVSRFAPPRRGRPDLRAEVKRQPRLVRALTSRQADTVIETARGAMVTRARSLAAFSYATPHDGWLVDDGDGLCFAFVGVVPERRHPLTSWYGGLTLRHGVPIGYVQADVTGPSAALSFNTFDTFRGGEAAHVFSRWLAALHALFGTRSFSIEPYQLGRDNDEGLESGAWWFYAKLGFRPRHPEAKALAARELERVSRKPRYRTRVVDLRALAEHHVFFDLDPTRPYPLVAPGDLGLAVAHALSSRFGADRERATREATRALLHLCGVSSQATWSANERSALARLAPWLLMLRPKRWPLSARRELVAMIRQKGAASERAFVHATCARSPFSHAMRRFFAHLERRRLAAP